ncbi:MAG: hypothetical protein Q9169_007004 [Polycauliona sp. 2 TL-2023]
MYTPFEAGFLKNTAYSAVQPDIHWAVRKLDTTMRKIEAAAAAADEDCPVCWKPLIAVGNEEQQPIISLKTCGHQFHQACIIEWINPTIPPLTTKGLDSAALLFEKEADRAHILHRRSRRTDAGHSHHQELVKIDLMKQRGILNSPASGDLSVAKSQCPMCRKTIFDVQIQTTDSIELMQLRLRLTNLAYQVCGYQRSEKENKERTALQEFLNKRWAEHLKQNPTYSIGPRLKDCVRLFKLARLILRDEAWRFMRKNTLGTTQHMRVLQLISFFENIALSEELVPAFFLSYPVLNEDWNLDSTFQKFSPLTSDPALFCSNIWTTITQRREGVVASVGFGATPQPGVSATQASKVSADGDVEMLDAL